MMLANHFPIATNMLLNQSPIPASADSKIDQASHPGQFAIKITEIIKKVLNFIMNSQEEKQWLPNQLYTWYDLTRFFVCISNFIIDE